MLAVYKPHIVVVMIGINDGEWVWKFPAEYREETSAKMIVFLKNSRVNKLARYLIESLGKRIAGEPNRPAETADTAETIDRLYGKSGRHENEKTLLENAIKNSPNDPHVYVFMGDFYYENGQREKAEDFYRKGMNTAPHDPHAYSALGNMYRMEGRYALAEEIFKIGLKSGDETKSWLYCDLGDLYRELGSRERAKTMYLAGVKADPGNPRPYLELGNLHRDDGELLKAKAMFESALMTEPQNPWTYIELGNLYRSKGEFEKSERIYETGIKAGQRNPWIYYQMGKLYLQMNQMEKAEKALIDGQAATSAVPWMKTVLSAWPLAGNAPGRPSDRESLAYPPEGTVLNYRKIRDVILRRRAKLVWMQYPMRSVAPLEDILGEDKGIIFVENKTNFENALKGHDLTEIFRDLFAGDFGHCTNIGNDLIADNLSRAILRSVGWEPKGKDLGGGAQSP